MRGEKRSAKKGGTMGKREVIQVRSCAHGHRIQLVRTRWRSQWWEEEDGKEISGNGKVIDGTYWMFCIRCELERAKRAGETMEPLLIQP
jgi:hypothetical protein